MVCYLVLSAFLLSVSSINSLFFMRILVVKIAIEETSIGVNRIIKFLIAGNESSIPDIFENITGRTVTSNKPRINDRIAFSLDILFTPKSFSPYLLANQPVNPILMKKNIE